MRSIFGSLTLLVLACGLTAGDELIDFSKLIGKWELAEPKKGLNMILEFGKDSKLSMIVGESGKETKLEGTYTTSENNKMLVTLRFMNDEVKESLTIKKLTGDELVTEDSKGKIETMRKKK